MGWKKLKEHYQIGHYVQVTEEGICIGSGYIHNIIVIGTDGVVRKRYDDRSNDDLIRYQREIDDTPPEVLRQLIQSPDTFTSSLIVYTYDGGDIIEKLCENLGWPNVTHDGEMMHDNEFSTDKATVVEWAKRNADAAIRIISERIEEVDKQALDLRSKLSSFKASRAKLDDIYPETYQIRIAKKLNN